jgi:hypothetical protein
VTPRRQPTARDGIDGTVAPGPPLRDPPKRVPVFLVTGVPCPDCACPVWLASTATDQEIRWFARLFTDGPDDLYLLKCHECGGTITAPSAQVNEVHFSAPP